MLANEPQEGDEIISKHNDEVNLIYYNKSVCRQFANSGVSEHPIPV